MPDNQTIQLTRAGLGITAIFSICLALYFENAVDIWYLAGSFVVPPMLIPLIAGLYGINLKHVVFIMIFPVIASALWYLHGISHQSAERYPSYILGLDPMYPGVILSAILFIRWKK